MRAIVVLAALLSLVCPGVSARAIELQSPISITLSLKAPAAKLPDLQRTSGKSDQLDSCGIVPHGYDIAFALTAIEFVAAVPQAPPSLTPDGPPLGARPPPLAR